MKTRFSMFLSIALLSGYTFFVSSCSKDDEEENTTEQVTETKLNDVDFVRRNLVSYDANGNYKGLKWGVFLDESSPATAYVSVENLQHAKEVWKGLIPYDSEVKADGDNEVVELSDENKQKQGEMRFNVMDSGKELAEIVFSQTKLIDSHVSRLVFIQSSLWPQNDGETVDMPEVMTRKTTGDKYVLVSKPTTKGIPGYIFHIGEKRFIHEREHQNGAGLVMQYFPSRTSLKEVAKAVHNNSGLLNVMSNVSGLSVDELKKAWFFESYALPMFNFLYSISGVPESSMIPMPFTQVSQATNPKYAGYWNYTSRVYLVTIQNGVIQLTMDHNFTKQIPSDIANEINLTMDDFE